MAGSCWTCIEQSATCSRELPKCKTCHQSGRTCAGYARKLLWPTIQPGKRHFKVSTRREAKQHDRNSSRHKAMPEARRRARITLSSLSPFGVPAHESRLIQHFADNVARIALAIDYRGNVYRSFIPMAMHDQALLYSIMAVSAAHLGRWNRKTDTPLDTITSSREYTRRALMELGKRLQDPVLAASESTLATMLNLISIEVGNGSRQWKHHYEALEGWLRWKGDTSQLDPFLKSWVFMAGFQAALVFREKPSDTITGWLETLRCQPEESPQQVVDPFLGYSVKLPRLLASILQKAQTDSIITQGELERKLAHLQQEIAACELDINKPIELASSCQSDSFISLTDTSIGQNDLWRRTGATAEIFRHAAHIYTHRIGASMGRSLPREIQKSVDAILDLLALVPDVRGPGTNLAWPLFVVGLEIDSSMLRDVILERWQSLHLLGMKSTQGAERVLLETWKRCDRAKVGCGVVKPWQDVMHSLGEEHMMA
ncbi:fungal-specific transcription factor domain-containing protein [Fusarium solani]|uniref:Fungal-specific transcription factor domain-containing protein n=1 Tax=Fusarium solani TaxID=169388 RepID=A0A9P9FZ81_FUSSL|nr:fungal-specific transcription factor domain-containing protein [Fusarium solani]KAH7224239.1 fungal-specific transcription factor domain-containing protein [Fusarium solani]